MQSLADLPRTPHHSPRRTSDDIRAAVIVLRNETGFGPRRLSKELLEKKGIRLSERTIWKIIRSTSLHTTLDTGHPVAMPTGLNETTSIAA